jgi:hypothetical protein
MCHVTVPSGAGLIGGVDAASGGVADHPMVRGIKKNMHRKTLKIILKDLLRGD